MRKYTEMELELLNMQIGCMLRLGRLKKGMSQLDLALLLGSNPTMIGRIERFENVSGWDKILSISQQLSIDFCNLFVLKTKEELLLIVEESFKLEDKLTQEKRDYYDYLKSHIINRYSLLKRKR